MPWEIKQGTSQCSGYGVFKQGTDQLEGCHTTKESAERQMSALYASENKVFKRGMLYEMLTEEEKAFHDSLVSIAEKYGPFDQGTSSIWVGYEEADENEDSEIGVKCSNCSFFIPENNGCMILSYQVEPEGKCRLAAIPDGLVNSNESETESVMKKESVRVGSMVSWNSSGGRARGKVKRIITSGSYKVPDSEFTINGTSDNPAVVIELYDNDKPTGRTVAHRMNSLTANKSVTTTWDGIFTDTSSIFIKKDWK